MGANLPPLFDPVSNIMAALRYVQSEFGTRFDVEYVEDHDYASCDRPQVMHVETLGTDRVDAELAAVSMVRALGLHPTRALRHEAA